MQPAAPGSSDAWCPAPSELTMPRCQAGGGDGPRARTSITPRVRAPKRRHSHCLPGVGFSRCQNRPRSRSPIISGRLRRSPRQLRLPPALPAAPHAPHSRGCSAARSPQCRAASTPSPRFPPQGCIPPTPTRGTAASPSTAIPWGGFFFFFLNDSGFAQQSNRCSGLRLQTCRAGTGWGPRLPLSAAARPHSPRNSSSSRRGAQPPLSAPPPMPAPSAPSPTRAEAANLRRSRRWREKSLPALSSFFPPPIFLPSPRPPAAPRTH